MRLDPPAAADGGDSPTNSFNFPSTDGKMIYSVKSGIDLGISNTPRVITGILTMEPTCGPGVFCPVWASDSCLTARGDLTALL